MFSERSAKIDTKIKSEDKRMWSPEKKKLMSSGVCFFVCVIANIAVCYLTDRFELLADRWVGRCLDFGEFGGGIAMDTFVI
jgi:hypothetical protein